MKRLLIIGAGKRVMDDVLPVVESLSDELSLEGIYARSERTVESSSGRRFKIMPLEALSADLFAHTDLVYIAVPPSSVTAILGKLPVHSDSIELIIDTPAPSRLPKTLLRHFARVHVAEDSAYLPWLELFETQEVKRVECRQGVYRYHGVALFKALMRRPVRYAGRIGNQIYMRVGSARVHIAEPRDYQKGTLTINGSPIGLTVQNNTCLGFSYNGASVSLSSVETKLLGRVEQQDTVISRMLDIKRVGLRRLMENILQQDSTWSLEAGQNDRRVDDMLHLFGIYFGI